MHKINGDNHGCSQTEFKALAAGAEMLRVGLEGSWQGYPGCLGCVLPTLMACCKTNAESYFRFVPFLIKAKSSSNFTSLVKRGANVGLS